MKNLFTRLMLVAVAALSIVACQTEPEIYVPEVNTFDMTIIADGDTRTELVDGTSINWSAGDQLSVVVNNSIKTSNALESATTTASFTVTVEGVTTSDNGYTVQAVYPADANKGARGTNYPNVYKIETATEQTPSTTSFDGAADMLVAKEVTTTEQPSELNMQFTRLVALGEMTLTKFTPESAIKSVTFSTSDTALTGRSYVNLSTTEVEYGYTNQAFKNVVLNYVGTEDWSNGYTIYFTCFPAELTTDFIVVVETVDGTKYTKTVTLKDKTLSFTAGDMTRFKVNMEGTKEVVADNTDVLDLALTGQSGSTYKDWDSVNGNGSSAIYAGNSAGGNNSIQLRSKNDNSGIVTTVSGGKATKVVVAWNSNTTDGRTLNIYGKNTAYESATDLYDSNKQGTLLGTIVYGTSTELNIDGVYQYIGMRSNDGAMYIDKIQITWAEMTADDVVPAEPLTKPSLETEVTENTITVSWNAITGATGYKVSINDDANTTATIEGTSYEFTGLTAGTEYTISVVALGDGETTTDSEVATIKATPMVEEVVTSYSYTFTQKQFSANGTLALGDLNWTLAGDGGYWGYDSTKGQHLGSGNNPYKNLTLSTSDFKSGVNKIVLETSGGSSVNATCTITVGGTQIGEAIKITSTSTEYTFEATVALKGEIVISYSQTSSKAIYIKSIAIN